MKYTRIARIEAGGQKLFQSAEGAYYLCDNSGSSPDGTDDGPLRINTDMPIRIHKENASVTVWCERDNRSAYVSVTHEGALELVVTVGMKVMWGPDLYSLEKLLKL